MSFYAKIAKTVATLLAKFGRPITILSAPTRTVNTVRLKKSNHMLADSGVPIGDVVFLFAPKCVRFGEDIELDTLPEKGDHFELEGETFAIMDVDPIKPADVVLGWYVTVRSS